MLLTGVKVYSHKLCKNLIIAHEKPNSRWLCIDPNNGETCHRCHTYVCHGTDLEVGWKNEKGE